MWVQFVVVFSFAPGGFFTGYFGFPLSTKTTVFKFQFYQKWYMKDRPVDVLALNLFINSVYLFIYLFIYFNYRYKRQYLFSIESDTCSQSSLYAVDPYMRSIKSYLSLNVIDHHWKATCCLQERLQLSRCIH